MIQAYAPLNGVRAYPGKWGITVMVMVYGYLIAKIRYHLIDSAALQKIILMVSVTFFFFLIAYESEYFKGRTFSGRHFHGYTFCEP